MAQDGVILEAREIYKDFKGVEVLRGITLQVKRGERHAIIGPNGAGKTTLFNIFTGRYKPSKGKIFFMGKDITGMSPSRIGRLGMARSFQITNIFDGLSVFENVRAAVLSKHGIRFNFWRKVDAMKAISEEVERILADINLLHKRDVPAAELAYGEQRALEIGIVLAMDPVLMMLDEPTAGMSIEETKEMVSLIERVTKGKTLIIIEHDMEVVATLAHTVTVIHHGEVIACGSYDEIQRNELVREAYLGERDKPC